MLAYFLPRPAFLTLDAERRVVQHEVDRPAGEVVLYDGVKSAIEAGQRLVITGVAALGVVGPGFDVHADAPGTITEARTTGIPARARIGDAFPGTTAL